jgi:hypothetical protein
MALGVRRRVRVVLASPCIILRAQVLAGSLVALALYRVSTTGPSKHQDRRAGEAPVPPPR